MSFTKLSVFFVLLTFIIAGCSAQKTLTTENPYSQASVIIQLKNGEKKQGIVLKREGNNLVYIDAKTHNKEKIDYANIKKLSKANVIYDFEANPIPKYAINEEKKMGKTLLYGAGGLVLGAATGTGVGIALVGGGVDVKPVISIAVFGLAGAWYFGSLGSDYDYEDAVFEMRKKRYKVSKSKRDREIEDEKRKLEAQQKQKEELLKKIDKKKKK